MNWTLLIFGICYGLLRGFGEGMVMHFPNVREHAAFAFYHWARVLEALCLAAAVVSWNTSETRKRFVLGVLMLLWEAFELSYFFARDGQVVWGHENIMGAWPVDSVAFAFILHAARVLTGLALLYAGRAGERR